MVVPVSLLLVLICAATALFHAYKASKGVLAAGTGTEEMQRIASAIQEGAQAYLSRQYRTIAVVGAVVTVLLLFALSFKVALGFVIGAYMPLSQFSEGLKNVLAILPGTYGVGIMRNHYMNGYVNEIVKNISEPEKAEAMIKGIKDAFDANLYAFGNRIPLGAMYGILLGTCAVLIAAYIAIVIIKSKKKK